jgi:hypothetical protein
MSKILKITDGDYKVQTGYAGRITLDTGSQAGEVIITGALIVLGDNTIVESETMTVKDNVIELNVGESGPGVTIKPDTTTQSGLRIHRSSTAIPPNPATSRNSSIARSDVLIVFDETIDPLFPSTALADRGTVVFKYQYDESLVSIRTNAISTGGANLGLINQGNGYITVSGTTNYQQNALGYTAWLAAGSPRASYAVGAALLTVAGKEDVIPNAQALVDYVDSSLYYYRSPLISEGNTSVRTYDDDAPFLNSPSRIEFTVDGSLRGKFIATGLDVDNVNIFTNTINNATNNLILSATTTNTIEVNALLQLNNQASDITVAVATATQIYTKAAEGPGRSGIYFTNDTAYGAAAYNNDELVSKNRAVLLSILL